MKFPEEFIRRGEFKLHSGQTSDVFYDVNALLTDYLEWMVIREAIPQHYNTYVGIATGGAIIASQLNTYKNWAMIKDGELKGKIIGKCCLIDDVCTTEKSLREAMKIIHDVTGHYPKEIFVVVDRRKEKKLHIESVYQIE